MGQKFWLDDITALFSNLTPFPTSEMTFDEKLNALTRLAIIVSIVLYYYEYQYWSMFLIMSILIIKQ